MKNILCVDDEPWTISIELQRLESEGFNTKIVSSVSAALRALDEKSDYDVIVIDVINRANELGETIDSRIPMDFSPKIMGLTFGELVRNVLKINKTPLVFYTVVEDMNIQKRINELEGTCLYLSKHNSLAQMLKEKFGERNAINA